MLHLAEEPELLGMGLLILQICADVFEESIQEGRVGNDGGTFPPAIQKAYSRSLIAPV